MNWPDQLADAHLATVPVEIRLFLEQRSATEFREAFGYGYAPQTVRGVARPDGGVDYAPAVFIFSGPVGEIRGYYVLVDGRVRDAEKFARPVPIVTPGSKIEIVGRIEYE